MDDRSTIETDSGPANPARRRILAGLLTAYTASFIPWALAQPVAGPEHGAFMALSALLAGRRSLNAGLGARLYDALGTMYPHFAADGQALLAQINQQHIDPAQLQQALDTAHSPLAPLPRRIMRAWCLGLVGEGEATRCIAYENALNAVMVADVLKPPTYAYGAYGSWARPPIAKGAIGS
ncbi:MAG: sugar dehydrogenase complex small subunit [Rhodanobacteraceae bacterium]